MDIDIYHHQKDIPAGKRLHNIGKIHHFQCENSLFLWQCSIAMLNYQRINDVEGIDCNCCHNSELTSPIVSI